MHNNCLKLGVLDLGVFLYAKFVYVCRTCRSETGPSKHKKFNICIRHSSLATIGILIVDKIILIRRLNVRMYDS